MRTHPLDGAIHTALALGWNGKAFVRVPVNKGPALRLVLRIHLGETESYPGKAGPCVLAFEDRSFEVVALGGKIIL